MKNTYGGLLLLVKLQAEACNFTRSNTPPWVFFTLFKLYEWYQIEQRITYVTACKQLHLELELEAYLESSGTSKMELFVKIVND